MWGNFCIKTKVTFFAPKNKCKKNSPFSFSLIIGCYLSFFGFVLLGKKLSWHRNILTNEKTTKNVCGLSCVKVKRKGFFNPMTNAKEKIYCVAFSLVLFCGDVWVSFFFVNWVNSFLRAEIFWQIISKIKAKTKTQKPFQFPKDWEKGSKRKVLAHCVKTTVYPLAQKKKEKFIFSIQLLLWETR